MTAEELLRMPRGYGLQHELINGGLMVKEPAGSEHGSIAMRIGIVLGQFVMKNRLGTVFAAETGFQLSRNPDTVRAPDTAFVSNAVLEKYGLVKGYYPTAPDLAVEVNSPSDSPSNVRAKAQAWLNAGTRMVIVLDPRTKTATMYRADNSVVELTSNQTLDGYDVVPGWSVVVSSLFE